MLNDNVLFEIKDGIAFITINRPESLNALTIKVLKELSSALDDLNANTSVRAIIVTGTGKKAFSAGADIKYLNQATPLEVKEFAELAVLVNNKIETSKKIVVAAINGYALGGGLEMAESCMLRVAISGTKLGHPEVRIGAFAGFGGTTRLPRLVGKSRATEMLLTGDLISTEKALEIGLINRITSSNSLLEETEKLVRQIISNAPISVNMTWQAIHRGLNMTLEESTKLGADYFGLVATTEDFRSGTKAFIEKRKPNYSGK